MGSACLELDENAAIISYEEYHPFGTTSYRSGSSETEVSLKRYKYVGKERDEETGLYYYGARYYSAWLCRFVSVDPLQFEYPHYTPYQYAGNKPITFIDLDGLEEFKPEPDIINNAKSPIVSLAQMGMATGVKTPTRQIGQKINISDPNKSLDIGRSGRLERGQGAESGNITLGTGIIPNNQEGFSDEIAMTNDELFVEFNDAMSDGTFGRMEAAGLAEVTHFRQNSGNPFTSTLMENEIRNTDEYSTMINDITSEFQEQMQANDGNYNDLNINSIDRPSWGFSDPSLLATIGGTQQIDLTLQSITFQDNAYTAQVGIVLSDNFGVDEGDTHVGEGMFDMRNVGVGEGLRSQWVLQHQRGFRPFTTQFHFNISISGQLNR